MPRRPTTKASRAVGRTPAIPTPILSTYTTPTSSAYPSTYASEAELDPDDDLSKIAIGALSLDGPVEKPKAKKQAFCFLALPTELRLKIYGYHFAGIGVIDLDTDNYKRIHKKLAILRTCRTIYNEATYLFYSSHTFRIFPTHAGRFFKTKKPLLARLNTRQRSLITSLELRLGPGWGHKPPRGWVVNSALGLFDCTSVRRLTVFVECDPSDGVFNGFRRDDDFYEGFCRILLKDVLGDMAFVDRVYFDAWSSVKKSGAMMRGLIDIAFAQGRSIGWGPDRGWTDNDCEEKTLDAGTQRDATATALLNGVGLDVFVVA
ncbi:hypothetical protein B0T26DRAFT_631167 [Lasiosphaeria miniovina]|uniref:DUF7730 domain-containing protein n=1 Tax=Lasiosphaeria miniovina TaxID=1954250 RepID=A0AA40ECT9_9PEZI|nr:uncharacterized protein B0T26DRAFT_631167 [Lasiosphaeria miniovina]KAK0735290.1 hypothetical protein B0T26DRAFT_631167 [Lasiosphaeria miniovina]